MQQAQSKHTRWSVGSASTAVGRMQDDGLNRLRLRLADRPTAVSPLWRLFEMGLAFGGLLLLLPFYPIIALAIKWNSPGPVLYKQQRIGFQGESFTCWKFRTMEPGANRSADQCPDVTSIHDRRVFAVGRFLRRTFLDELPQLWNVLKGDMHLIGPRPYPVNETIFWNENLDGHAHRYAVKPGITGLAQIRGYRGGTLDSQHMQQRLEWDLYYVRNRSTTLDLHILQKTLRLFIGL